LDPTEGTISVLGKDAWRNRHETNEHLNFAAVYAHLPGNLTVWQNLKIFGMLYSVPGLEKKIDFLLKDFHLEKFANSKAGTLSSGEQSRLMLAKAVINEPRLLLLDEPTASIDPSTAQLIRQKITTYAKEKNAGLLWTSHNMQEIESTCDRVMFLSHGKILLEGDPKTLPGQHGKKDLEELFIAVAREPLALDI
jgi:ABC-2 type transport system ATP-binding protein